MESDVYVLRPCMIYLVQINNTHAITVDFQQILFNSQVIEQPLKAYCLLHSLRHGHVLSSVVDNATLDCRIEHQLTGALDNVNTYPIVDRRLSRSPA